MLKWLKKKARRFGRIDDPRVTHTSGQVTVLTPRQVRYFNMIARKRIEKLIEAHQQHQLVCIQIPLTTAMADLEAMVAVSTAYLNSIGEPMQVADEPEPDSDSVLEVIGDDQAGL